MFKRAARPAGEGRNAFTTNRPDWDAAVVEMYARAIEGTPFGIGMAAKEKTLLGHTLRYRMNPRMGNPAVQEYIRKRLDGGTFDKLFESDEGLEPVAPAGLMKVVGDGLGLPRNALIVRVVHASNPAQKAVVIFGGERLEGHLERRVESLRAVLEGRVENGGGRGAQVLDTPEKQMAALENLNVKRLYDYDLDLLSRIVNGLEETKEELPKTLKPKFKTVSDYIIKRRVKR